MRNISVPCKVLAALIDMANEHIQDIKSGIEVGIYLAAENKDIGDKEQSVAMAEGIYRAEITSTVVTDTLTEEELADFMRQRVENGDLALEDIPARLARFGLMEPAAFVSEMRERMEMAKECA